MLESDAAQISLAFSISFTKTISASGGALWLLIASRLCTLLLESYPAQRLFGDLAAKHCCGFGYVPSLDFDPDEGLKAHFPAFWFDFRGFSLASQRKNQAATTLLAEYEQAEPDYTDMAAISLVSPST